MSKNTKEIAFETAIEKHLLKTGGYGKGNRENFDSIRGLDPKILIDFIKKNQAQKWETLSKLQKENTEEILIDNLCKALDSEHEGCLTVLRHGFKCFGETFKVAYFSPASKLNPDTQKLYSCNKLTITRQLKYSSKNQNSIKRIYRSSNESRDKRKRTP